MSTTIGELLGALGRQPLDPGAASAAAAAAVSRAAPLSDATPDAVTFCGAQVADAETLLGQLDAAVLIVDEALAERALAFAGDRIPAIVSSPSPRLDFARVVARHFVPPRSTGVHPAAVVDPAARLGDDVYVGPAATIGPDVVVGDRTTIHAGVHLYGPVTVGADVTIHAGTVVGASGYGYERADDGTLVPFPQIGSVEIGDGAEIGANACIDRGALGPTRIGAGAKIDNLVHVAHNVQVGADAAVIAHAMVGGGVRIGARAWIAPTAAIREQLTIGDDATVGVGSVVTKPVPDGTTVTGSPARELQDFRALTRALARLVAGDGR